MKLIFIFLITILDSHMYALNVEAMVGNSLYKSPDFKAQIIMKCGYYNQYLDRTGVWLSDPQGTCTNNYTAITEYCKSIYPTLNITNVLPMGDKPIKVDNWCAPNQIKCDKSFQVVPIRCLEGKFQSEALLVPEGCVFDHVHSSKLCIGEGYWHNIALQACAKKYEIPENIKGYNYSMLRSYSMLLPCGIAAFSGVEFVCCKSSQSQTSATPTMNLGDAAGTPLPNHVAKKSPDAVALNRKSLSSVEQIITQKPLVVSNVVVKNSKVNSLVDNNVNVDYKPLEPSIGTSEEILNFSATNMKREDLTDKTNPLPISFTTSTPSTPDTDTKSTRNNTTRNNIINDKIILDPINNNKIDSNSEEASTTISSNINDENLIKSYYATFDKDKEHERFVDVKNWMKDKRRKTIINLMKDWTLSEKRFNQIKSKDPYLAQKYKEDISKSFQKTISALEAEEKAQKKQLTAIHEQRVTSLLNAKKRRFMFQFLKELEKPYPTPELLKETLERLLRAEERDKMHVIHYYEHLLNSDPSAASRVRAVVARHIADVERRMNRSVIMLERRLKPEIYAKLKPQIDGFVNTIKTRNGDFAELTRSIVNEKEVSTLAYTAGASTSTSDDKTDTTTQEVPDLQSSSQSLNSNNDKPEEADDENYDDEADEDETDDENEEADDINDEADVSEKNLVKNDILSKAEANEAYNNNTSEGGNVETNKIKGDNDRDLLPYPFVNIPSHDFAHTNENSKAAKRSGPSPHYEALSQESGMVSSALHGNGKRSTTFNMGVVFSVMAALAVVIAAALMIKKYVTRKSRFVMYAPPGGLNKNHPHQHAPIPTREEDCPDYLPPLNFGRPNYNSGGRDNNRGGIGMFGNCGGISRNQLFKKNLATVAQPSGNIGLPSQYDKDNVSNHVEIDNQSLEERHLANMQVNGYENPTYRYFEKIASKA